MDASDEIGAGRVAEAPRTGEWTWSIPVGVMQIAGLASMGAGAVHAAVSGLHTDHVTLTRLFVLGAVLQLAAGLWTLIRGGRLAALATLSVSLGAVAFWAVTRISGISFVSGLEDSEPARFADSACAALGAVAVVAAGAALARRQTSVAILRLGVPSVAVGAVAAAAMLAGVTSHSHSASAEHAHDGDEVVAAGLATDVSADHSHDAEELALDDAGAAAGGLTSLDDGATGWPQPWNPAAGIDFSASGATRAQQLRASGLLNATLRDLPQFADTAAAESRGYRSIGDSGNGFEHYINYDSIGDDTWLDPNAPESLVYEVDGDQRTLVSAMFIVPDRPLDDPELVDYGGPLMQWHSHENLCWAGGDDGPRVVGVVDENGGCPPDSVLAGGGNPMVHVWIAPHDCGPFAALEGHGAGQTAAGIRTDQCAADHHVDGGHAGEPADGGPADGEAVGVAAPADGTETATPAAPPDALVYDPAKPIDLSGTPGVSVEQQAFAENLIADTVRNLPQWSDPAVAEAAGFRSIRDGATGHEHFINWDWINDDVFLDPDAPESLVYEPQPDGSRRLVSAMFMLPDSYELADVPDWGGPLMQWHIHDNLCFTDDAEAPVVGGLTDAAGECTAPLRKLAQSPMIHVWITPQKCGPFAALDGVGAGQVVAGEEHQCDEVHGAH